MLDVAARAHQSLDELTRDRGTRGLRLAATSQGRRGALDGGIAAVAGGGRDVDDVVLVAPALVPPRGDARTTTGEAVIHPPRPR